MNIRLITYLLSIFFLCSSYGFSSQSIPRHIQKLEDSLLNKLTIAKNDSLKVNGLYDLSRMLYEYDYIKGIEYIDQSIELAERIGYDFGVAKGHYVKGLIFYYMSRYDMSLEELFYALKLNKKVNSKRLYATINNYIGINYRFTNNPQKSLAFLEKSLAYYTELNDETGIADLNNNIGLFLFDQEKYDEALIFLNKGFSTDRGNTNRITNSILNIIQVHFKKKEFDLAYKKLTYLDSIKDNMGDFLVLAEFYYAFGYYYKLVKDYDNAIQSFQKSVEIGKEKLFWLYVKKSSKELSDIYIQQKKHEKSLEMYKQYTAAKDSLLDIRTQKKIIQLDMKNDYDKYLGQLEISQQQKKVWYLLYGVSSFLFCIILGLSYYMQRRKNKLNKKEHEYAKELLKSRLENSSLEKMQLEYELDYKKKELDYKNNELVNFALQIIQNNDFVKQIREKLKVIVSKLKKEENLKLIDDLDFFVKQTLNLEKSREEFYAKTKTLHKNFLYELSLKFPSLSSKEKELALLLRLGYSSKEISVLLNISSSSVDMARYRLRKKLNITPQTSLHKFFSDL